MWKGDFWSDNDNNYDDDDVNENNGDYDNNNKNSDNNNSKKQNKYTEVYTDKQITLLLNRLIGRLSPMFELILQRSK